MKKVKYWVARDRCGLIFAYPYKPRRCKSIWHGEWPIMLDDDFMPELTWEDEPEQIDWPIG